MKNNSRGLTGIGSLLAAAAGLALLTGCAGYKLGSLLPPDIKTVFVPTVVNMTGEPFVENEVTRFILERLQLDGSLRLATAESADSILEVTVRKFELQPIAFNRDRGSLAQEYRIILSGSMLLKRRVTDEIIVENPNIKGNDTFELVGDLSSGKRVGLPGAASDFARDVVEKMVEFW